MNTDVTRGMLTIIHQQFFKAVSVQNHAEDILYYYSYFISCRPLFDSCNSIRHDSSNNNFEDNIFLFP